MLQTSEHLNHIFERTSVKWFRETSEARCKLHHDEELWSTLQLSQTVVGRMPMGDFVGECLRVALSAA